MVKSILTLTAVRYPRRATAASCAPCARSSPAPHGSAASSIWSATSSRRSPRGPAGPRPAGSCAPSSPRRTREGPRHVPGRARARLPPVAGRRVRHGVRRGRRAGAPRLPGRAPPPHAREQRAGAPEQGDKAQVEGGPELPSEASLVRLAGAVCCEACEEWSSRRYMEPSGSRRFGGAPRRRSPTQRRGRSTAPDRRSSRSRGLTGWRRRRKFDLSLVLSRGAYTTFRDVTAPPGLVLAVPANRLREAGGEVGMLGLPAQHAAELGAVDGVAPVVAGAVAHPVEVILEE